MEIGKVLKSRSFDSCLKPGLFRSQGNRNVNHAVKSSYLLSFLESVPEVSAKLNVPETRARKFEDVVESAGQMAVLVLVY